MRASQISRHQKRKRSGGDVQKGKDSLACPIRAAFGRLPTGDLTLPAEVAGQANCLSPLPRLPGFVVIRAARNPLDCRFPLPCRSHFDFHRRISVLGAGRTDNTGRPGRFAAINRGQRRGGSWDRRRGRGGGWKIAELSLLICLTT